MTKLLKKIWKQFFLPLSEKHLSISIKKATKLSEKLQITIEREPDFLRIIETNDKHKFILHIEFQTKDDTEMVYRMAEYKAILQRKFRLEVKQFVIFLGNIQPKMATKLPSNGVSKWIKSAL